MGRKSLVDLELRLLKSDSPVTRSPCKSSFHFFLHVSLTLL